MLFFYPFDFTFVCPTEILSFSQKTEDFAALNTQVLGLSCDSHHVHLAWTKTKLEDGGLGSQVNYPLVADITKDVSEAYGVLTADKSVGYYAAPMRAAYIIDPSGTIRSVTVNDEAVGRNVDEILRVVEAFQYADSHEGEGCPAGWTKGDATIKADPKGSREYFESAFTKRFE